ncbi:CgeB family protein [Luteibaculum oceani]|uniref:Glycosyltransferase family 1 protein n=1 Tax=Luteibaculum oceani TaxID=1294296 RepID=A0A5C6V9I2_9FLAO|nr:glycosyltransferase [Luteibaculum oceani]TXC81400.1 glycosyltransferase family 1 protein [Luteibaculum oceani]
MKVLYIGQYAHGETARMRGEILRKLLHPVRCFEIIDISKLCHAENRFFRTVGWRFKIGPLIWNINKLIFENIKNRSYDLIWVDKGVFLKPKIVKELKSCCNLLVHFTPDPAFMYHQSRLFNKSVKFYDYLITTKRFEVDLYKRYQAKKIILTTQGYDRNVHVVRKNVSKEGIVFIGHYESNRGVVIKKLLEAGYPVKIAGINWRRFCRKHNVPNLCYLGQGVFAEEYSKEIGKARIAMGFLSKIIPEEHTTRSFEIPACGTVLATERTSELLDIFSDNEVIYYDSIDELIKKLNDVYDNTERLKIMSYNAYNKLSEGNYEYTQIMQGILNKIL